MAQATATINLQANTQDAEASVSRLENNIKTLDGAINLVGGSIEVLAGGLAITGAVTEEQAERFQAAAVGAIALADGSKRALEGFKILATETNVVAKAQKALNIVLRANPLGLIVSALAVATTAFVAYRNIVNQTKSSTERATEAFEDQTDALEALNDEQKFALDLLKAQGATREEVLEKEVELAKERKQAATDFRIEQQLINQFSDE